MENKRIAFYRKWQGVQLEDWGGCVSKEYNQFQNAFKRVLTQIAKDLNANLVWFYKMHYDESCMFERNGKYVYLCHNNSLSNRSMPYLHHILIRTAEHSKDYHGGTNDFVNWAFLTNKIDEFLGGNGHIEDTDLFPSKQKYPTTPWF